LREASWSAPVLWRSGTAIGQKTEIHPRQRRGVDKSGVFYNSHFTGWFRKRQLPPAHLQAMKEITTHCILVIDDNPNFHSEVRRILGVGETMAGLVGKPELAGLWDGTPANQPLRFEIDSADQGAEGLARISKARADGRSYTLVFLDARAPSSWDRIEFVENIFRRDPAVQVVLCMDLSDGSGNAIAKRLGPTDRLFLLKRPIDDIEMRLLASSLARKWGVTRQLESRVENLETLIREDTTHRKRAEEALRDSESHYRLLFENNPTPVYVYDHQTLGFLAANEAAVLHYGYSREEFLSLTLNDIALAEEIPAFLQKLTKPASGAGNSGIWRHRKKDGKLSEMELTSHSLMLGTRRAWLSLAMDVTERLSLEAQLRQSQKMESVGQLAGGIAHDFNNLLTVISGHSGILLAMKDLSPQISEPVKEISEASRRAADLTRQLLTFSRKQVIDLQVIDLNEVVKNVSKLLRRILGEDISLEVDFSPTLSSTKADLGMIEQILLNLAVNSRDAMPKGGKLRISTSTALIDEAQAQQNPEASAGRFVCLTFADTGCGIAPENLPRIFEPFFTTKEMDRGTGLGLATVYGIIKQHQGWIQVDSQLGAGATFQVFLPASSEKSGPLAMAPSEQRVIGGTETILVVEDELPLLKLIHHILESHGYKVVESTTGKEALENWEQRRRKIDLLLTDMILPDGMTGPELAHTLQSSKPELKVIYTSGYDAQKLAKDLALTDGSNFIQKPFHARKLAETVFDCLNSK
jgi:two-component system, cell cycle sensor histidine kinase and response regulator CckA